MPLSDLFDVAICGAGPVGCVTAIAFARRGAHVLIVEAQPEAAARRLAGEWLHPPAVRALESLGIGEHAFPEDHARGNGFVVFPENDGDPIVLPYADCSRSFSCAHGPFVQMLRSVVTGSENVAFLAPAVVRAVDGTGVTIERDGERVKVRARLVVGADGRASRMPSASPRAATTPTSLMAGLILEDVVLPFEGYGHVVLGGPGPVLIMRIGARQVRVCLDVPLRGKTAAQACSPEALHAAYGRVMPPSLLPAFEKALHEQQVMWSAISMRRRSHGNDRHLALVGDAVGHFHPMTAAGMTVGFLDAVALASSSDVPAYARARIRQGRVAELLADTLYWALQRNDPGTEAVRAAIFRLWRQDVEERLRTMRFLSGDETDMRAFRRTFSKVLLLAARGTISRNPSPPEWHRIVRVVFGLGQWMRWPLEAAIAQIRTRP